MTTLRTLAHAGLLGAAILMSVSLVSKAGAAAVYYVAGQVHPRFEVDISINGAPVRTVTPSTTTVKAFLKQIDAGLIGQGANDLSVTYRVRGDVGDDVSPTPSFRVQLYRQEDAQDTGTRSTLSVIEGPGRPFGAVSDGALSDTFQSN